MIGWRSPRVPFYFHAKLRQPSRSNPSTNSATNSATNRPGWSNGNSSSKDGGNSHICSRSISRSGILSAPPPGLPRVYTPTYLLISETGSFYGSRRMKASLDRQGMPVSRRRVQRLMRLMGLRAIYRRPRTSQPAPERRVYPHLLRNLAITRANQVWAADITYLPMARGFLYLVAIMDWHSRYVVAWRLSNTLETGFCAEALNEALGQGTPEVFNTDRGSQFTSSEFIQILQDRGVKISMDGRGRYQDNIFVERLWRTVKYEEVYPEGLRQRA